MSNFFCVSISFLDPEPTFHGRRDAGEPEWPPSPLRVFQALVAASASRWGENYFKAYAQPALEWLEVQSTPLVVAPRSHIGVPLRIAVPNNDMDVVASAWAKRQEPKKQPSELKTMKTVRPTRLRVNGSETATVRYLWPLTEDDADFGKHKEVLSAAARSVTHLGWGIDMVAVDARVVSHDEADKLAGERWSPSSDPSAAGLRVPRRGTLDELIRKHEAFLSRVVCDARGNESYSPVPPLAVFRVAGYRRLTEPGSRPWAAFSILKPDASGYRSFDTTRRARDVAGMMRHAVAEVSKRQGWSDAEINVFVHGKSPDGGQPARGAESPDRFMYLPLPTINHELDRVESIRRMLVAAPPHCRPKIDWLRRTLSGAELKNDRGEAVALVTILPGSDWVLRQYVGESTTWSTVTPVILPIHEGYDADTAGEWLRTAFEQAGYAPELLRQTELEWRRVGFRAGVDLTSRYLPPKNLENKPRYHVRVRFPHAVAGPVVVGSGRFRGFGLFARIDE